MPHRVPVVTLSQAVSEFVQRHVLWQVNQTKGNILQAFATVADDTGRTRNYLQRDVVHDVNCSLITVKRCMTVLLRPPLGAPGPFLLRLPGRCYLIVGFREHDPRTCDNEECAGEDEARRRAGGRLSERKRRLAAERAREYRRRRREQS